MEESLQTNAHILAALAETSRVYLALEKSLMNTASACVAVTSALPGEGKTLVAAGLAVAGAKRRGRRVLAIDLNWYKPGLHSCFDLQRAVDLDTFQTAMSLSDLVQPSGTPNLDVLAAPLAATGCSDEGPDLVAMGLEVVNRAREAYDVVIVDTASVFPINRCMMDPVTIAKHFDGALMVVLANVTPRQRVKRAQVILESSGAQVLGMVVNQWKNPMY